MIPGSDHPALLAGVTKYAELMAAKSDDERLALYGPRVADALVELVSTRGEKVPLFLDRWAKPDAVYLVGRGVVSNQEPEPEPGAPSPSAPSALSGDSREGS